MNSIHGERGKRYYAVECKNRSCRHWLYVSEALTNVTEEDIKTRLAGESVRCHMCTQETPIESSLLVVIEIR